MKQRNRNAGAVELNLKRRLREGLLIASGAVALFLFLALWTYHPNDPTQMSMNLTGRLGAGLAHLSFLAVGSMAYLLPALLVYCGWQEFSKRDHRIRAPYLFLAVRLVGFVTIFVSVCGLATLHSTHTIHGYPSGGILGEVVTKNFITQFNIVGSTLFLSALLLASTTLATGFSWMYGLQRLARQLNVLFSQCYARIQPFGHSLSNWHVIKKKERVPLPPIVSQASYNPEKTTKIEVPNPYIVPGSVGAGAQGLKTPKETACIPAKPSLASKLSRKPSVSLLSSSSLCVADDPEEARPQSTLRRTHATVAPCDANKKASDHIALPSLSLLDPPETSGRPGYTREELEQLSRDVELRLRDFNIQAQVVAVHPGPVVTRFEIQPAAGIKVSRITGLAKDLARALSVVSVRIVEVIPGKSVVGLEVANRYREIVRLSEILTSQTYQQARSPLSLALGKDIAGHPVVVDLGKMPHLLVAGTTGSGKSVGLNAMLLSILYKASAQEVRLIMIDPKMLELAIYEGIPHLLTPVVTDMKEAARALRWCVAEMERRYKLMARLGVRNVAGYNQKIKVGKDEGHPLCDPFWTPEQGERAEALESLPYIIVLIDEFADMMMVVGKKVEELIARIAQKARAAGIHLILATQRPSVDVITGLIKANIPTRIAFQVSSKIDSRTILDQQGADQLLGHGDMLYLAPGTGLPIRIHGAFVADQEVHDVVNALRKTGLPEYSLDLSQLSSDPSELSSEFVEDDLGEKDGLYDEAVQILLETRRASVSNIQRRLKIGYNRAARLMEDMEKAGLVSAMETNGNREILVPNRLAE